MRCVCSAAGLDPASPPAERDGRGCARAPSRGPGARRPGQGSIGCAFEVLATPLHERRGYRRGSKGIGSLGPGSTREPERRSEARGGWVLAGEQVDNGRGPGIQKPCPSQRPPDVPTVPAALQPAASFSRTWTVVPGVTRTPVLQASRFPHCKARRPRRAGRGAGSGESTHPLSLTPVPSEGQKLGQGSRGSRLGLTRWGAPKAEHPEARGQPSALGRWSRGVMATTMGACSAEDRQGGEALARSKQPGPARCSLGLRPGLAAAGCPGKHGPQRRPRVYQEP